MQVVEILVRGEGGLFSSRGHCEGFESHVLKLTDIGR